MVTARSMGAEQWRACEPQTRSFILRSGPLVHRADQTIAAAAAAAATAAVATTTTEVATTGTHGGKAARDRQGGERLHHLQSRME